MNTENFIVTISKEKMSELPAAEYSGKIVTVDKPEEVEEAIKQLSNEKIIGFDTETRPSFKKGMSYTVALLQLSTHTHTYLFRLNKIGFPEQLKQFLQNPDILKIGLSIHDDFHSLNKLGELHPQGFVDLQQYAKEFRIADNSLTRIHSILFGKRISKNQRLTNWEADTLTEHQKIYASLDALACIHIYEFLKNGKFKPEESEYFQAPPPPVINPNQIEKQKRDAEKKARLEAEAKARAEAGPSKKKKRKKRKKKVADSTTPTVTATVQSKPTDAIDTPSTVIVNNKDAGVISVEKEGKESGNE